MANEEKVKELQKMVEAYRNALEHDYCQAGEHQGERPDEIALQICDAIEDLDK